VSLLIALFLVGFASIFWAPARVSADEVLRQIHEAEVDRLFAPGKIVHQRTRFSQRNGSRKTGRPDGAYTIERWWNNAAIPRSIVYRMHSESGSLVEASWVRSDGTVVNYSLYESMERRPRLTFSPNREVKLGYVQRLPEEARAILEEAYSIRDLSFYERQSEANWERFLAEIRDGEAVGSVQQAYLDGESVEVITALRSNKSLGSYRWIGTADPVDHRLLEVLVDQGDASTLSLKWREIAFEVFDPGGFDFKAFELDSFPADTRVIHLSPAETVEEFRERLLERGQLPARNE
jgi:hypothetical protein